MKQFNVSLTYHAIEAGTPEEAVEKFVQLFMNGHRDLSYDVEDDETNEQWELSRK